MERKFKFDSPEQETDLLAKFRTLCEAYSQKYLEELGVFFGDTFFSGAFPNLTDSEHSTSMSCAEAVGEVFEAYDYIVATVFENRKLIPLIYDSLMAQKTAFGKAG